MITMEVSFDALLNSLSAEKRAEIYDYMSCESAVVENVVQQIVHGCTSAGSWAGDCVGVDRQIYPSPIMVAKRWLVENSKDVIADEAKRYLEDIDKMRAEIIALRDENMKLSMQTRSIYGR